MISLLEDNNKELDLYNALIKVMSDSSICGLGQAASNCVSHLIKYFPEEFWLWASIIQQPMKKYFLF